MIPSDKTPFRLSPLPSPVVRHLGVSDYLPAWRAMQEFTARRAPDTPDEIWILQHPPVYTLGLAGRPENLLQAGSIPLIKTDRGGQITYHGPGQIVTYLLLDMKRRGIGVRELVRKMEQAVIALLAEDGVTAEYRTEAPGVYVNGAKIAALGLRVKNGCCYHGLALNVDMDLTPFAAINPCGYAGMAVTQTTDLGMKAAPEELGARLGEKLLCTLFRKC